MQTKFSSENLNGRKHLEDLCIEGGIMLIWILKAQGGKAWARLNLVWIGSNKKLLWTW